MGHVQSSATTPARPIRANARKRSGCLRRILCKSVDKDLRYVPSGKALAVFAGKNRIDLRWLFTLPPIRPTLDARDCSYAEFISQYPEYHLTSILDALRRSDFTRLARTGETYVDYMGGALYPESLVRHHFTFLHENLLGNTHSVSNSSTMSSSQAAAARASVLSFFKAPPEYTVIFTSNASGALKLVGEAYPFVEGSSYVLAEDSHNSVHGIRAFATRAGADARYIPSTAQGGVEEASARSQLLDSRPRSDLIPCLFAFTGQSNISNCKNPLSLIKYAESLGYHTLLDAAAMAPTALISLNDTPVDAMAISFYKMFGYPTGVGALVVKKTFLAQLHRPWFAGGTVDIVQVPGTVVTMASQLHEQFEDGTINYLALPAIEHGLRFLSAYLPFLPLRLSILLRYLTAKLAALRHPSSGAPVVRILSRLPTRHLRYVGEQADTGSIVSLLFLSDDGTPIPNSLVAHAAAAQRISLRTGCMCNPGGTAALLGLRALMAGPAGRAGVTLPELEAHIGRELGVVRMSLGLASDFTDVHAVLSFAARFADVQAVAEMRARWLTGRQEDGNTCC